MNRLCLYPAAACGDNEIQVTSAVQTFSTPGYQNDGMALETTCAYRFKVSTQGLVAWFENKAK